MSSRRIDRVNELLKHEIGEIIRREFNIAETGLISVNTIEVSPDLRTAKVFISVLGGPEERKRALQGLKSGAGYAKRSLSKRLQHLRRIPDLTFDYDESIEAENRIESLFNQIKSEPE